MRLLLASRNAHKVAELRRMEPGIDWVTMPADLEDPPETGETFEHNALEKAEFVSRATGAWVLADDSGLEVRALGGQPGVRSKRYSLEGTDEANNQRLLAAMQGEQDRSARYRCVLALVGPAGKFTAEGACEGTIGDAPRGNGGFGYDPLFWPGAVPGRTMAQLSPAEKDAVSHRGVAMRKLPALLARAGLR